MQIVLKSCLTKNITSRICVKVAVKKFFFSSPHFSAPQQFFFFWKTDLCLELTLQDHDVIYFFTIHFSIKNEVKTFFNESNIHFFLRSEYMGKSGIFGEGFSRGRERHTSLLWGLVSNTHFIYFQEGIVTWMTFQNFVNLKCFPLSPEENEVHIEI